MIGKIAPMFGAQSAAAASEQTNASASFGQCRQASFKARPNSFMRNHHLSFWIAPIVPSLPSLH